MSGPAGRLPAALSDSGGTSTQLDAHVVAAVALDDGSLAVGLGDGRVAMAPPGDSGDFRFSAVHAGACLALAVDLDGRSVLSGGDDGILARVDGDGRVDALLARPGRWIDQVAVSRQGRWRAAAAGRAVHLLAADGTPAPALEHPSTVAGLAFDPDGQRLAASHYGGVTVWPTAGGARRRPRRLAWAGSHLGLTWSSDGRYLVSATQENALHGWRMRDGLDMQMSGYPVKVRSTTWLPEGRFLATAGAETVVCWPFAGRQGPMGKPPVEAGPVLGCLVTAVAAHPSRPAVAAGYENGTVLLVPLDRSPPALVKRPGSGEITALAWSPDGRTLVLGTDEGLVVRITRDWTPDRATAATRARGQ